MRVKASLGELIKGKRSFQYAASLGKLRRV